MKRPSPETLLYLTIVSLQIELVSASTTAVINEPLDLGVPSFDLDYIPLNFSSDTAELHPQDLSGIKLQGFKKGDWKKPTKWSKKWAKRAKYGDGVTIGIVDTGINCSHKNLKSDRFRTCTSYYNKAAGKPSNYGHGSNAAGVAAGTGGYGLAPRANIAGIAAFNNGNWYLSNSQFLSGMSFLVNNKKAKVVNWSFGVPYKPGSTFTPLGSLTAVRAIRNARNKALVVKSAGNGYNGKGKKYSTVKDTTRSASKNALKNYLNNLIVVGALDKSGKRIAKWSDRPGEGCLKGYSESKCTSRNKWKYYFIVAPGYVNTTAGTGNGSTNTAGTSFSAPIVSGAAALIQSRWPKLKPHQVRDILLKTATDKGKKGVDGVYGRGVLNVTKALKPVRGKVGGVKVNKASAMVFNRLSSLGDFAQEVTILDAYGRDFSAVNYHQNTQQPINEIDAFKGDRLSLFVSNDSLSQDNPNFSLRGIKIDNTSYFSGVGLRNPYTSFDISNDALSELPASLLALNQENQALIHEVKNASLFAMMPQANKESDFDVTSIGWKHNFSVGAGPTVSSTVALLKENGFHGLSSQEGFGFEGKNNSAFVEIGLTESHKKFSFDFRLNHHQALGNYSGSTISWNNIGITEFHAGLSRKLDSSELAVKLSSGYFATGSLSSSINNFETLDDFYRKDPALAVKYSKNLTRGALFDVELSTEDRGEFMASYKFNF